MKNINYNELINLGLQQAKDELMEDFGIEIKGFGYKVLFKKNTTVWASGASYSTVETEIVNAIEEADYIYVDIQTAEGFASLTIEDGDEEKRTVKRIRNSILSTYGGMLE